MKVYVAAFFGSQERLVPIREELERMGHEVLSVWLDEVKMNTPDGEHWEQIALRDEAGVLESDIVVIDTLEDTPRGGREFEGGICRGVKKPFYVVGQPRNVFHHLADARFKNWDGFLQYVRGLREC